MVQDAMSMPTHTMPHAAAPRESNSESAEPHPSAWAAVLVFAVACAGIPWVGPVAAALPLFWQRYRRRAGAAMGRSVSVRWVFWTLVAATAAIGLVGARAVRTIPMGVDGAASIRSWLHGAGSASPGIVWMLVVSAIFVLVARVARGAVAWLVAAVVVLQASAAAATVYARAENLIAATPAALPLWTVAWLAGMAVVMGDAARRSDRGRAKDPSAPWSGLARWLGPGLLALAIVLRLALASLITAFARRVTLP